MGGWTNNSSNERTKNKGTKKWKKQVAEETMFEENIRADHLDELAENVFAEIRKHLYIMRILPCIPAGSQFDMIGQPCIFEAFLKVSKFPFNMWQWQV